MTTNDDKRKAIITELSNRASTSGATGKYFTALMIPVMDLMVSTNGDAVELMGLLQAIMRQAVAIAYGTVAHPGDLQIRTPEDMASMMAAIWDDGCRNSEELIKNTKAQGLPIPPELEKKIALVPSDPSNRPDVAPVDPVAGIPDRPMSFQDLLNRINNAPEPKAPAGKPASAPEPSPAKPDSSKLVAVWSPGSTIHDCSTLGNGKGN